MKEWLERVEKVLSMALQAVEGDDRISRENMYTFAPAFYSQVNHVNNEQLLAEMSQFNDEKPKFQYKYHFVSAYLYCYVVAGKIDEFECDEIMDYLSWSLDLSEGGYSW
ncbi:hypothetical protein ACJJIF_21430 [Microbulbifer sp. SSSA002]|uniref:hypothetical protein n=1 Tax=unclassified Microbulbifer TaxID=2619833 RepID=UPI004039EDB8